MDAIERTRMDSCRKREGGICVLVETDGQYSDEISNRPLDREGVIVARLDEIQQIRNHNVYVNVPLSECHQNTG